MFVLEITQMKIRRNKTDYWCISKKVEGRPSLKLLGMDVPDRNSTTLVRQFRVMEWRLRQGG